MAVVVPRSPFQSYQPNKGSTHLTSCRACLENPMFRALGNNLPLLPVRACALVLCCTKALSTFSLRFRPLMRNNCSFFSTHSWQEAKGREAKGGGATKKGADTKRVCTSRTSRVCFFAMYVCMRACMHACMSVCLSVCRGMDTYIDIYIYVGGTK